MEITDPKAIRALAHAARLEVISELYSTQVSRTATELAAQTGLTPSAMSYHLRALQKWGIVAPAPTAGDARERRWKAAGTDFAINSGGEAGQPRHRPRTGCLPPPRRRLRQDPGRAPPCGAPAEAPTAVLLASDLLYLTREQQADLNRRLFALLSEYELEDPHRIPDGAERMAAMWSLIPDDRTVAGTGPEDPSGPAET